MAFTATIFTIRTTSNDITRSSVPNATRTLQQMWKVRVYIHLHTYVEYECQSMGLFPRNHACSTALYARSHSREKHLSASSCPSVSLPIPLYPCISTAPIRRISVKFLYWRLLRKSVRKTPKFLSS